VSASPAPTPLSRRLPLPLDRPLWVYVLLAAIVIVFLLEQLLPLIVGAFLPWLPPEFAGATPADFAGGSTNTLVLVLLGANFRPLVLQGQVWRFFTSMFLRIGFEHLLFNAYGLFIFGAEMERVFGRTRFLLIYVLSGLFGSLVSFATHTSPNFLSAGASGAIFGLVGMQLAYFYHYRHTFGEFGRSRLLNVLLIVGLNVFLGFSQAGIDNMAHLGGLVSGALLGRGLLPQYEVAGRYTERPRVVNRADLRSQIWVPALAVLVLAGGTALAIGAGGG